jgi:hypothetical protein
MRLVIAVPSYGDWCAEFGHSLALLMAALASDERITSLRLSRCESTIIADGRNDIVRDALEHDATHLLWLDSDMRFRSDAIDLLMSRDLDIVACTYPKRRPPYVMTAQAMDGSRIVPGDGVVEASHIGMGVALVKAPVFAAMNEPWFATPWVEADQRFVGEDVFWCHKARAHGFKVWVDCEASADIGHCGRYTFTADDVARFS